MQALPLPSAAAVVARQRPCEECGGPDAPITHEVFWEDSDDADPAEPEEEFCPSCGRQTVTTVSIDWGDDDPA